MHIFLNILGNFLAIGAALITSCCFLGSSHAQTYQVKIHVLGNDGKAVEASHASLTRFTIDSIIHVEPARLQGNTYEFSLNARGMYRVYLTGVHHLALSGPILVEDEQVIEFEARLGTLPKKLEVPDSVFVSGSFNNFSLEQGHKRMTRQKNGTYTARVTSDHEIVAYRPFLYADGDIHQVDATDAAEYQPDPKRFFGIWVSGNFYALMPRRWETKLVFDPTRLLTSDLPGVVSFSNPASVTAKLLTAYLDVEFRVMKMRLASKNFIATRQLGNEDDFLKVYDLAKDLSYLKAKETATTDADIEDFYKVAVFQLIPGDSAVARNVSGTLSPTSSVWKIGWIHSLLWSRYFFDAIADRKEAAKLAERIAGAQDDDGLRAGYLGYALDIYYKEEDEANFTRLYNLFMYEFKAYPKLLSAIKKRNPLNRKIAVGKVMPDFSFVSLDHPDQVITSAGLSGKTYLIDLWATWCSPCIAEMKNLHEVYQEFRNQGFKIVSISFDDKSEAVAKFRKNKWSMPWFNVFANESQSSLEMVKIFEGKELPRAILVNSEGTIIAIDEQIKGQKLQRVLKGLVR